MLGNHYGVGSRALGRTGYGTEVSHISDAVEHYHKGKYSGLEKLGYEIVDGMIGDGRHHGYHALMVLAGDAVETFLGHTLYHESVFAREGKKFCCKRPRKVFPYKQLVYFFTGLDGFHHSSQTEDVIVWLHYLGYFILEKQEGK